jgi:hypothetical protein
MEWSDFLEQMGITDDTTIDELKQMLYESHFENIQLADRYEAEIRELKTNSKGTLKEALKVKSEMECLCRKLQST